MIMGNGAVKMWSHSPMERLQTQSELDDMNQEVRGCEDSKTPLGFASWWLVGAT